MQKSTVKQVVFDVLRAVALALVVNVVLVLLIAIVVKYSGISATAATAVNQVAKVLSIAVGALVGVRSQRLGWLIGAIAGALYTTLGFGLFSLLNGSSLFADVSVFDYLLGVGAGIVSGIQYKKYRTTLNAGHVPSLKVCEEGTDNKLAGSAAS